MKARYLIIPLIIPLTILVFDNIPSEPEETLPDYMSPDFETRMENEIFDILNEERDKRNIPPLSRSGILDYVAERHSKDMATNDFFEHRNLKGENVLDRVQSTYICFYVGENLARERHSVFDSKERMNGLMNSPSHKDAILNDVYDEVGLSVERGDEYFYLTQVFCG